MSARVRRTVTGALVGAGVAVATLTGCGAGDQVAERAAEKAVEKAVEEGVESGASGQVDVDIDGEEFKVESSDGSFTMGGEVPDDFPSEVPLADGKVVMSSSTPDGWSVIMEVDGEFTEVSEVALDAIVQAGFSEDSRTTAGEYVALMGTDGTYDVMVTATPADSGGTNLSYTVTEAQ